MLNESRRTELAEELGEDFLDELTTAFWDDAWALLDFGVTALVNEDAAEMRKVLHTLTGSAGNLGLSAISAAAEAANYAVKAGERPDLDQLQAIMLRTLAVLQAVHPDAKLDVYAISA